MLLFATSHKALHNDSVGHKAQLLTLFTVSLANTSTGPWSHARAPRKKVIYTQILSSRPRDGRVGKEDKLKPQPPLKRAAE